MKYSIVEASIKDSASISELTKTLGYETTEYETQLWLSNMQHFDHYCVLLASTPEQVLGWLVVEKRLSLETGFKAEITGLVVSSLARRLGVGKGLVLAAQHWAQQQGLKCLMVRSNVAREESHDFYQALDFIKTKTTHVYQKSLQ